MDFLTMTGEQLAEQVAVMMFGPAPAHTPEGAMMYPPVITGRIVRGLTLDLAHEFFCWYKGGSKEPVNYIESTKTAQHMSAAEYDNDGRIVHPVGQVTQWHSQIIIGHVIVGGKLFEHTSIDRARASVVATLKAANG